MMPTIRAWLHLLRLPNLFTAPGDPVAGAVLAGFALRIPLDASAVGLAALASLCLYACGVVANDALGAAEDARERPERPIPSGRVSRGAALTLAVALNLLALCGATSVGQTPLAVAFLLSACIWGYNAGARAVPLLRPAVMGLCRGLSLILGAALVSPVALGTVPVLLAAAGLTIHVAAITAIASREVETPDAERMPPSLLLLSPVALLATLVALTVVSWQGWRPLWVAAPEGFPLLIAAMAVAWSAVWCGVLFGRPHPEAVRASIGRLVRGILLVQAAFCAAAGAELAALALLAAFPVSSWIGNWIQGS